MTDKHILIIEDNAFINSAYGTKFNRESIPYKIAVDGEEALAKLQNEAEKLPAVVILDLILPKKNGFEVLSVVKNDPRIKMIPVIVLTNLSAGEEAGLKALSLGAALYLIKSQYTPKEVVEKIRSILNTQNDTQ